MPYLDEIEEYKCDLIVAHLMGVIRANFEINLTSINSFEEGMMLHIEDSLSALAEVNEAPEGLMGDLGSGAGYPGVPLAIASERKTVLIDSRLRKMEVVQGIIEDLKLQDLISTYAGRAELLARSEAGTFSVLTARALSQLSVLLELASPLLKQGGHLVCYKANVEKEEFDHALEVEKETGMKLYSDRSFKLDDRYNRRIIVFEKASKPTIKLPRLEGAAQKNPL